MEVYATSYSSLCECLLTVIQLLQMVLNTNQNCPWFIIRSVLTNILVLLIFYIPHTFPYVASSLWFLGYMIPTIFVPTCIIFLTDLSIFSLPINLGLDPCLEYIKLPQVGWFSHHHHCFCQQGTPNALAHQFCNLSQVLSWLRYLKTLSQGLSAEPWLDCS